jgi:hypothetical protein
MTKHIFNILGFDERTSPVISVVRMLIMAVVFGWSAYAWSMNTFVSQGAFKDHCAAQEKAMNRVEATYDNTVIIISALKQHGYKF